jgi:hypothetical protein
MRIMLFTVSACTTLAMLTTRDTCLVTFAVPVHDTIEKYRKQRVVYDGLVSFACHDYDHRLRKHCMSMLMLGYDCINKMHMHYINTYFFKHSLFLQLHPLLCAPLITAFCGSVCLKNAIESLSSKLCIARSRSSSNAGIL